MEKRGIVAAIPCSRDGVARLGSFALRRPMGEGFKEFEACLDVIAGDGGEAVGGKGFASEGGDDGTVDNGAADVIERECGFAGGC